MPRLGYLLDTNALSEWLDGAEPIERWMDEHRDQVALSTLTLAELKQGIAIMPEGKARRELEREYRFVLQDFSGAIWCFDESAAAEWGELVGEAHARNHPLPVIDSLIGAIARSMGAKVVTADKNGFLGCVRVNPWTDRERQPWS